jgi:hypothetical protein
MNFVEKRKGKEREKRMRFLLLLIQLTIRCQWSFNQLHRTNFNLFDTLNFKRNVFRIQINLNKKNE